MPNGYQPMGQVPDFYTQLLNSAQQQLVRQPDGTFAPAPQYGQATTLNDLYKGIIPSVPGPLKTNMVNTVPIDPSTGNPVIAAHQPSFTTPTMASTMAEQSGSRPALTYGTQPAGTAQLPPGVRPGSVDRAFAQMGTQAPTQTGQAAPVFDPFRTYIPNQNQSRLPPNDGGEAGFLAAFGPQAPTSPALGAITQAAGVPPMPRVRPIPPAQIPLTSITGGKGTVPQIPGPITFKEGDTVGKLAKGLGMTVSSFSDLYGIANPNKIYAGATVTPQIPTMPRMPSPAQRTPPMVSNNTGGSGFDKRNAQEAKWAASGLNAFGMLE